MKIFEKLKNHADQTGLSYTEIGNRSGKSQQTISNYFSGKNQIPLDWLIWYLDENQEIDVSELFNKSSSSLTVQEDKPQYGKKKVNKARLLEKIALVIDEEL